MFNGILNFVREGRAQDAVDLLRSRLAVRACVVRGGRWAPVKAEVLVPGDVVHVRMGDIVPADLWALEGSASADKAVLTGGSTAIEAAAGDALYAGSPVRLGEATGQVTATGTMTYFGHTAERVHTAQTASHLEETIFEVVWALLALDGVLVIATLDYRVATRKPLA